MSHDESLSVVLQHKDSYHSKYEGLLILPTGGIQVPVLDLFEELPFKTNSIRKQNITCCRDSCMKCILVKSATTNPLEI